MQQERTKTISLNVCWNSDFSLHSYLLPTRPCGMTSLATEAHSVTALCLLSSFLITSVGWDLNQRTKLLSVLPAMLVGQYTCHRKNIRLMVSRLMFKTWLFYLPNVGPQARFLIFGVSLFFFFSCKLTEQRNGPSEIIHVKVP